MSKKDNIEMMPICLPDGYLFIETKTVNSPKKVANIQEFSPTFFKKIMNKSDYTMQINNYKSNI